MFARNPNGLFSQHHEPQFLSLVAIAWLSISGLALAGPKSCQVTSPVLAVTDASVTVQMDDDKWEIARDGKTKITGEIKVGAKVTIENTVAATTVDVKGDDAKPAAKPDKKIESLVSRQYSCILTFGRSGQKCPLHLL